MSFWKSFEDGTHVKPVICLQFGITYNSNRKYCFQCNALYLTHFLFYVWKLLFHAHTNNRFFLYLFQKTVPAPWFSWTTKKAKSKHQFVEPTLQWDQIQNTSTKRTRLTSCHHNPGPQKSQQSLKNNCDLDIYYPSLSPHTHTHTHNYSIFISSCVGLGLNWGWVGLVISTLIRHALPQPLIRYY